ncbi:DUF3122 domain-containing protein [Prochlorococcus sp. MIT 1307]|uniref:DUF3122 domain-containing protein n=1 Tax=Prochlorococcus sp. MIT 1307 TaxID=3096219 RepID=UPI002A74B864|nr:DUF3122 domain-containing protein [Prochlorococcus sp. MIT 1307]
MNLKEVRRIKGLKNALFCFLLTIALLLQAPSITNASLLFTETDNGRLFTKSLESLRDVDYQTWQVVAYPNELDEGKLVLRIVGYPGTLRMDHPNSLVVHAGRKDWLLQDITLSNSKLVNDSREAAAEFDLSPLVNDLRNNRPLRLMLPEVFNDLPVPPYVVSEWRSLLPEKLVDGQT